MPLSNYSVLLGAKVGYHRDPPDAFGRFYHGHIDVQTPAGLFNTAIDVDTERAGVKVSWRIVPLRVSEWAPIFGLADGMHGLTSTSASGAVDYVRDVRLQNFMFIPEYVDGPIPWWRRIPEAWQVFAGRPQDRLMLSATRLVPRAQTRTMAYRVRVMDATPPWKTGTDIQALSDLESMITDAPRVAIFGAAYPASGGRPPGLHDIHLNQGDPAGSQWWSLDGIWQDGLTIAIHSDGTASAFMNMFSTQSLNTDAQGHPL
jgi:hypothetical protein